MASPTRRIEVFASVQRNHFAVEPDTDDVILVNTAGDRTIPQRASSNLFGVSMTFDNEKIILRQRRSGNFHISSPQGLDLSQVQKTAHHICDAEVGHHTRATLSSVADLKSPLDIS